MLQELLIKPDLSWAEPPRFRAERRLGEVIRIRWPSHVFFLVVVLAYLGFPFVHQELAEINPGDLLGAVGIGILLAYIPLLIAKHQPLPVRVTTNGILLVIVRQAVILPAYGLVHLKFSDIADCVFVPALPGEVELESLIFRKESGEELFRIGLSQKVKRADIVDLLKRRGVACEDAQQVADEDEERG